MQQNFFDDQEDPLSLERIRNVLVKLEDTIIFCIIERAQFALNPRIYQRGAFKELTALGFDGSWLEWFLKEIETFHGQFFNVSAFVTHTAEVMVASPNNLCSKGKKVYQVRSRSRVFNALGRF